MTNDDLNPYQTPAAPPVLERGHISPGATLLLSVIALSMGMLWILFPIIGTLVYPVIALMVGRAYWMCYRRSYHQSHVPIAFALKAFYSSSRVAVLMALTGLTRTLMGCLLILLVFAVLPLHSLGKVAVSLLTLSALGAALTAGGFGAYRVARRYWSLGVDPPCVSAN